MLALISMYTACITYIHTCALLCQLANTGPLSYTYLRTCYIILRECIRVKYYILLKLHDNIYHCSMFICVYSTCSRTCTHMYVQVCMQIYNNVAACSVFSPKWFVCMCVCVCVCPSVRTPTYVHTHTHTYMHTTSLTRFP